MLLSRLDILVSYNGNMSKITSGGSRSITLQWSEPETILAFGGFVCVAIVESTLPISEENGLILVRSTHQFTSLWFPRVSSHHTSILLVWDVWMHELWYFFFHSFIQQCGSQITHLRLNSVKFFNVDSLQTVSIVCEHLKGKFEIDKTPEFTWFNSKYLIPPLQSYRYAMLHSGTSLAIHWLVSRIWSD